MLDFAKIQDSMQNFQLPLHKENLNKITIEIRFKKWYSSQPTFVAQIWLKNNETTIIHDIEDNYSLENLIFRVGRFLDLELK